ncbi:MULTISPECIES: hypothetical protein [unclassified Streptomyces]|uniref:hypothetical protein n=1 Tax=unclassified Streptomyces TaxID=2593676 RepID=UPI002E35D7EC|nr:MULTISPECIES: hypothetical protein [unclassified Streptomyces]
MNRPPYRPASVLPPSPGPRLLVCALTVGVLWSAAACSNSGGADGGTVHGSPLAEVSAGASAGTLTVDQARAALITNADLPSQWTGTSGAATWRDGLLKSKVDASGFGTDKNAAADCQKLLDGLYAEELLGPAKGTKAVTGFDDTDNQAQMHYQVAEYGETELHTRLAWVATLPQKCAAFTAVDGQGGRQNVQVVSARLPDEGDARQGLQVTMNGQLDGEPSTLTLDVAAVRVGGSALFLTNGGLNGAESDSTAQAVQQGTPRLQQVLEGKTPAASPTN